MAAKSAGNLLCESADFFIQFIRCGFCKLQFCSCCFFLIFANVQYFCNLCAKVVHASIVNYVVFNGSNLLIFSDAYIF